MKRNTALSLLGVALALALPVVVRDQYLLRLAVMCCLYIMLASANNLLMRVGQLSLGPVAFYGIGAYVSALLSTNFKIPFWICLPIAGLAAAAVGWGIGRLTVRLRTAYFVLVTIGFAEFFRLIALNWVELTNGPMGITAIPAPATWVKSYAQYYYLALALVIPMLYGLYRMEHSAIGRGMQAIRENEPLAHSVGIGSHRYMMLAAVISSFIIGIAGSFYAHFFRFVGPEILAFELTVTIVVMMVAGGRNTLAGPVIGAIIFTLLPELLRAAMYWRMAIYGLLLMLIILYMPSGIVPAVAGLWRRIRQRTEEAAVSPVPAPALSMAAASGDAGADAARSLRLVREKRDGSAPQAAEPAGTPLLSAQDVCVYFGGVHAVEKVSFSACLGEILSIIGPNGAGKTTMLNAITGVVPITAGAIHYRGVPIHKMPTHEISRQGVVRTFQHTSVFPAASTRRNLVLAHTSREPDGLRANLLRTDTCRTGESRAMDQADEILAFTRLSENAFDLARSLPYGNQRLLELGIALAAGPELLLLDEPAAGMNPAEVGQLMDLLLRIRMAGITVVLVEHDMKLVMGISDRILVLNYGQQIAMGAPEQIRNDPRVIEAYLGGAKQHAADQQS